MNFLIVFCFLLFLQPWRIASEINNEVGASEAPGTPMPADWKGSKQRDYELSYSQLHVMSDLMIEITLSKCPELNQTAGRKLKTFIRKEVARAPPKVFSSADPDYFSLYTDLRNCLQELQEARDRNPTNGILETSLNYEDSNKNKTSSANSTQKINSVDTTTTTSTATPRTIIPSMEVLSDLIKAITMLARHTCPFSHTLNSQQLLISSQIGNQILEWISKDQEGSDDAADYVQGSRFLDNLNACHRRIMFF